ncbi:MAG: baseplate J/gp47 family protein [Oscillospiraceae bacterium]|jgi:phage-related baseplate assembly protein|nr:baseplate J/gp47 family protein [Oscillospiraceae bacterium]
MINNRNPHLPDVNFVDTNTQRLLNEMITGYEIIADRKLMPSDPVRIFINWIADLRVQERVLLNEAARQNLPRYATGDYLDSLSELFKDTYRLQPEAARTTLRFTISAPQQSAVTIPADTRVTVDGEITFATTESATVPIGETSVEVPAVCLTAGIAGNGFIAGQISQIVDLFQFFESVENTTTSAGGSDIETDESLYERYRQSMETFSTAGPLGAYEYHAKTAGAEIVDVKPYSPSPGVVDIRILLKDGKMPDEEMKKLVLDTVSASHTRPLTDLVKVSAPDPVNFGIDLVYYIPKSRENNAAGIQQEVENAVDEYVKWQTQTMGRDINPDKLTALIWGAGAKRAVITSPVFTVVEEYAVAVKAGRNVIYGGIESD